MSKQIYDQSWHDAYSAQTIHSARKILPAVFELKARVESVCEFGCGHGHWLSAAREAGVGSVLGIDGAWTDRQKLLFPERNFRVADLSAKLELDQRFDLCISLEVGEHLPARAAAAFVNSIARSSSLVLFGAAIPFQGGYRHINERYPSYWADLFDREGFSAFDIIRPSHWADKSIHYYYRQNILIFAERADTDLIGRCRAAMERLAFTRPLDVVHPEKYDLMASYQAIALKRLLPKLPRSIVTYLTRHLNVRS
jgi:Methyltransferase domain